VIYICCLAWRGAAQAHEVLLLRDPPLPTDRPQAEEVKGKEVVPLSNIEEGKEGAAGKEGGGATEAEQLVAAP
jgi:hypothetical protein